MITDQLITGLRRIAATNLELPLIPLNNNKQPLGDGWQNRPFTVTKLIEAIEKGGVEVPIKGKSKKIQLQGFGLLTGRPITNNLKMPFAPRKLRQGHQGTMVNQNY
jgi:hypothetical protein